MQASGQRVRVYQGSYPRCPSWHRCAFGTAPPSCHGMCTPTKEMPLQTSRCGCGCGRHVCLRCWVGLEVWALRSSSRILADGMDSLGAKDLTCSAMCPHHVTPTAPVVLPQVGALLAALHINPAELPGEMPHVHDAAWHEVWAQQQQRVSGG